MADKRGLYAAESLTGGAVVPVVRLQRGKYDAMVLRLAQQEKVIASLKAEVRKLQRQAGS